MTDEKLEQFLIFNPVDEGTLWRVRENVWIEKLTRYDKNSKSKWHPGLSTLARKPESGDDVVPLLHGTSVKKGPVVVEGISAGEGYSPDHKAFFGHLVAPVRIPVRVLSEKFLEAGPFGSEIDDLWYKDYSVVPNVEKARISEDEHEQLTGFLRKHNLQDE